MRSLLEKLSLAEVNPGACTGRDGWITDPAGSKLVSSNPATGRPIATVIQATPATYERVVQRAVESFRTWQTVPAPKRGQLVRDLDASGVCPPGKERDIAQRLVALAKENHENLVRK